MRHQSICAKEVKVKGELRQVGENLEVQWMLCWMGKFSACALRSLHERSSCVWIWNLFVGSWQVKDKGSISIRKMDIMKDKDVTRVHIWCEENIRKVHGWKQNIWQMRVCQDV